MGRKLGTTEKKKEKEVREKRKGGINGWTRWRGQTSSEISIFGLASLEEMGGGKEEEVDFWEP